MVRLSLAGARVREYHIWEAELSELLECVRETKYTTYRYAVAVQKKKSGNNSWPHSKKDVKDLFLISETSRLQDFM